MLKRPAREYVMSVVRFYKGHISGWLLAIVAIGLNIAAAHFVDDPSRSAMVVRWAARLTTAGAIWLVFVAQYDAWKKERTAREEALQELKRRLTPKAIIRNLTPRVWPAGSGGVSVTGKEYYFDIFNASEAESLENVRVEVAEMVPDAIGYPNAPLHIRNDDYDTREFTINPGSVRQIDLITGPVRAPNSQQLMIVAHTVNKHRTSIPHERYRISVRVSARNTPPVTASFETWIEDEELQCAVVR
jgi:hypothetical protein